MLVICVYEGKAPARLIFSNILTRKKKQKWIIKKVKAYTNIGLAFNWPLSVDPGDTANPGWRYIPE